MREAVLMYGNQTTKPLGVYTMSTFMSFIFAEAQVRVHLSANGSIAITDGTVLLGGNPSMPSVSESHT